MGSSSKRVPGRGFLSASFRSGSIIGSDPFIRLPPEIRMMIFRCLPTSSIGKARIASPACAAVELGDGFFKTYFELDGWYGFLHLDHLFHDDFVNESIPSFAREYALSRKAWCKPSYLVATDRLRRVWFASLELMRLVATRLEAGMCYGHEWFRPRETSMPTLAYRQAGTIALFQGPERLLDSRWIQTNTRLREIQVSTMKIKDRTYISGFCFIQKNGKEYRLGFIHPDTAETAWSSSNMIGNRGNPSQIRIAHDRMGIRGLRFWGRAYPSSWIGDCDSNGMMMKRVKLRYNMAKDGTKSRVFFVEARFDVSLWCYDRS